MAITTHTEQAVPLLARVSGGRGDGWPLQFVTFDLAAVAAAEPQAVALTYWFDTTETAETWDSYRVAVRFTGRRLDVTGVPGPQDRFQVVATVPDVRPGMGRIALTHRVTGVAPGRWKVDAVGVAALPANPGTGPTPQRRLGSAAAFGQSLYGPVAALRAPGVLLGSWTAFVGAGALAGAALQWALARATGLPAARLLVLALVASLVGLIGAKVYYRLTHLSEKKGMISTGTSLQGFIIGAVIVFAAGAGLLHVPVGGLLDITVPALLLGQAIGRLGCFFAGCCTGLPTTSRWGLWSSDRQIGVRRIPVQLLESACAAVLAGSTSVIVLLARPTVDGVVFLAGLSAYVVMRQLLFPLRGLPRKTVHGRHVTLVTAVAVFLAAAAAGLLG
jgi:phosphatidylglycerol:prolipoprotein diacylglycerol transferase